MTEILTPKQAEAMKNILVTVTGGRVQEAVLLWDSHEAMRQLVANLAGSLRDFGADLEERRGSMYRRAAEALDLADKVLGSGESADG